jgi:hypothetical protein
MSVNTKDPFSDTALALLNSMDCTDNWMYQVKLDKPGQRHHNNQDRYEPDTDIVFWDPHLALKPRASNAQSPALGLLHELKHDYNKHHNIDDGEDEQEVMDFEAKCAGELGEGVRKSHSESAFSFKVTDPTKTGPVPPPPAPIMPRILQQLPPLKFPSESGTSRWYDSASAF